MSYGAHLLLHELCSHPSPILIPQLSCGSQQEAEACGGDQAALGALLALPALRLLLLQQTRASGCHKPPGFMLTVLLSPGLAKR